MDVYNQLLELEEKYQDAEPDEQRAELIAELMKLYEQLEDEDTFNRFIVQASRTFGGILIPYLFWDKLSAFYESPEERIYLQQLIKYFANSNFYDEEQKMMKSLLVVYFAKEKEFELDKARSLIIDKAHQTVREYFYKLISFVEKNQKSTKMYLDKFDILKDIEPNFELLSLPLTDLKEKFQKA